MNMYTPIVLSFILWGAISCNGASLPHHIVLREDVYDLFYDYDEENITFEVHVATKGYFGFGISPNGGMEGSDIVIGWVKDEEVVFHDRHATRNAMPIIDESQDWILESGTENDTHTIMRFKRPIKNCDPDDMDIPDTTTRLIWSYALDDPTGEDSVFYHGAERRGTKSVQLLNAALDKPVIPEDAISVDLRVKNVNVPASHTVYWCEIVEIPELETDHHLIMYEPVVTPGNEAYNHHMIAYMCPETVKAEHVGTGSPCFAANMPRQEDEDPYKDCETLVMAWAIGGDNFYYPEHVGVKIGPSNPIRYLRMEMHYDNPEELSDIIDSSGLRLWLTPTLRKFDAGIMQIGMMVTPMHMIPYQAENFLSRGHCSQECLAEALQKDEIQVFSALGHTHLVGTAVKVRHFRDNVEQPLIYEDANYDFNFQEFYHLQEEVTIKGSDRLMVDCSYKTMNKNKLTYGGLSTEAEMCLSFLMYYPAKKLSYCESQPIPQSILYAFGILTEDLPYYPYYKITAPEEYVGKDIFQIAESTDWTNVDYQKTLEASAASGYQFFRCAHDETVSYAANYQSLLISDSQFTFREEEKSCKELTEDDKDDDKEDDKDDDKDDDKEDDKDDDKDDDKEYTSDDGSSGAATGTWSFFIVAITLGVLLLC